MAAKQEAEKNELRSLCGQVNERYSQLMEHCRNNNVIDLITIKKSHENSRKTIQKEIFNPIIAKISKEQHGPYIKEAKKVSFLLLFFFVLFVCAMSEKCSTCLYCNKL
jgi:hypothetical protein